METIIRKYILSQYPNEACGIICNNEFFPITNVSDTPEIHFKMDPIELVKLQKTHTIDEVVHSHTYTSDRTPPFDLNPCTPSQSDYINQQKHNVPWRIYATEGENVTLPVTFPQSANKNLIGREFIFYINDCFTLIRDFYAQNMGIELNSHSNDWTWEDGATTNCYEVFCGEWGFEKVDLSEVQYGDVIIMSVLGDCNHAGIYIGDSLMIHHLTKRKSCEVLVTKMSSFVQFALRYNKNET